MHRISRLSEAKTSLLVLSLLEKEELDGSQMIRALEDRGETVFEMQEGAIYPVLHQLVKKDLLEARWMDLEGRERKYYRITAKGREKLKKAESRRNRNQQG